MWFRGFEKIASEGSAGPDCWRAISVACGSDPDPVVSAVYRTGRRIMAPSPSKFICSQLEQTHLLFGSLKSPFYVSCTPCQFHFLYSNQKGKFTDTMLRPMAANCQREKTMGFNFFFSTGNYPPLLPSRDCLAILHFHWIPLRLCSGP